MALNSMRSLQAYPRGISWTFPFPMMKICGWRNGPAQTVDFSIEVSDVVQVEVPQYNLDYVKENTEYTTLEEYEQSIREYLEEELCQEQKLL